MASNYRQIPAHLRAREAFRGNSMSAEVAPASVQRGRLSSDVALPASPAYVVYSYATPIAWVEQDGSVVVPDERYSKSTSRQQNLCRAWL